MDTKINPKYSILFLAYDPEAKLTDMINNSLESLKQSSIGYDYELLIDSEGGGSTKAINRLFLKAKGEYLVLVCSDTFIEDPNWLQQLSIPKTITTYKLDTFHIDNSLFANFSCICIPKDIQEQIGLMDERFNDGYGYDDNDYCRRASLLGIPQIEVPIKVTHLGSATFNTYFDSDSHRRRLEKNHGLFYEKWKL